MNLKKNILRKDFRLDFIFLILMRFENNSTLNRCYVCRLIYAIFQFVVFPLFWGERRPYNNNRLFALKYVPKARQGDKTKN